MASDAKTYGWLLDANISPVAVAGCLTLATGQSEHASLAAFGADPSRPAAEVVDPLGLVDSVGVLETLGAVLAVEFNGYQGTRSEVLRALSVHGRAASVQWNAAGDAQFACARRGRLVASIDLHATDEGNIPAALRTLFKASYGTSIDPIAVGAAMVERFTGLSVITVESVTDAINNGFRILPPIDDLDTTTPEIALGMPRQAALAAVLAPLEPDVQRRVAESAALLALARAGIDTDPRTTSVLIAMGKANAAPFTDEARTFLVRTEEEERRIRPRDPYRNSSGSGPSLKLRTLWGRIFALRALRYATHEDPFSAALFAVDFARHLDSDAVDAIVQGVSRYPKALRFDRDPQR